MSTNYPFQLEGASGSYDTSINGFEFTAKMILSDVEGDNDIQVGLNALIDSNVPLAGTDPTGPPFNAGDPFDPLNHLTGCWLRTISHRIIDRTKSGKGIVELTLKYQHSQWGIIQIDSGSQLSQVETNYDLLGKVGGNSITTEYEYPSDYGGDNPTEAQQQKIDAGELTQGGTVTVLKPEPTRVYTVRQDIDPLVQAAIYTGTVNNILWWGGLPRTWLCSSITGTSDNAGVSVELPQTWVNRYEFQYRVDGWDPEIIYSDDLTGEPVPDPVDDVGIKKVESYFTTDFWDLFDGA
jgi:hypothetical protein